MSQSWNWSSRALAMVRQRVLKRRFWSAAIAASSALALLPILANSVPAGRADETTISQDQMRTGWDQNEPALTPGAVSGGQFGQLFSTPVNGEVYAQPLVVGASVIVATENDWVYSLNRTTGAVNWSLSLGTPWAVSAICTDLLPDIGVTSTPVYDAASGTIYLVANTIVNSTPSYSMYGINVQTGTVTEQVPIAGSPTNDPNITFKSSQQYQRPGLLEMNGWVYAAFGSHCDGKPYDGYVVGVNVATQATTMWSDEAGVTDDEAGIWQGGGGLMSDGPGRIFLATGNGVSPAPGPGNAPPGQLAESVVRLAVQPDGSLAAQDFFSPKNAPTLDAQDLDFGSGGPVGLPFATNAYNHMLVSVGKYGRIYLLNRDNLGGRAQGAGGSDASLRIICCFGGEWGHPSEFADTSLLTTANNATSSDFLYTVFNTDRLREMRWAVDSTGLPNLHTVAMSSNVFSYTSGSPVVTSNGTDPSSAIVWVEGVTKSTGLGGTLYAFSAVPPTTCTSGTPCTITPLWSAPIGTGSKFVTPATDSGDVYVGTRDGNVYGFGITTAAPLAGTAPAAFGQTSVGASAGKTVTVTAAKTVTVTGVSATSGAATNEFAVGQVTETKAGHTGPVSFPVVLSKGDKLHAPVTFSPTAPGGVSGALAFGTQLSHLPAINVPLSGNGVQPGLAATPSSVPFDLAPDQGRTLVPVGLSVPRIVEITNSGTTPETVTSVTAPKAPFSASGLPKRGTVIKPGKAIAVQVFYSPASASQATGSFTINGNNGASATVSLSGGSTPAVSQFTSTTGTVNFGTVHLGKKVTTTVGISNVGNQPAVMTAIAQPSQPFGVPFAVAKGLPVNPDYDLVITLTFTPKKVGPNTDLYELTYHDKLGTHHLKIHLVGNGVG